MVVIGHLWVAADVKEIVAMQFCPPVSAVKESHDST
jgi:hypothetical protein